MAHAPKKRLGDRGEALVADWLRQAGWRIVAQQWYCRWGELDIVALQLEPSPCLAFVEVKTRRQGSLDQGGRLAITPRKQHILGRSAAQFLFRHPHYGELPCRFDVAIVARKGSQLMLADYIEDAFQAD